MTDVDEPRDDSATARAELAELARDWHDAEPLDMRDAGTIAGEQRSLFQDAMRRFTHNRIAVLATIVLLVFVVLSVMVPWKGGWNPLYSSADSIHFDFGNANLPISTTHPFGTDPQGRDLWKRAWEGGRISLAVGVSVALVILIIGVAYGTLSGYFGGRIDNVMMRALDSFYGLPYLPFAIVMVQIVRAHVAADANALFYMVPALSLTAWFTAARVMRGQILSLKENDYVEAARSQGASPMRVMWRHLLPNTVGVMIVSIALEVPGAILGEAFLSFIGLGVQPPNASWGRLAFDGANYFSSQPNLVWVPGLLIATTVLCSVAIADGLRDALDPRTQR